MPTTIPQPKKFCLRCSEKVLKAWKGWPHKEVVPYLPELASDTCPACGSGEVLLSNRICWFNYHSEYNTGLPDYWLLQIDGERTKWGFPYFTLSECRNCEREVVVSQMCFPNGTSELRVNCSSCGLLKATACRT